MDKLNSREWHNQINAYLRKETYYDWLRKEKYRIHKKCSTHPAYDAICNYCMYCEKDKHPRNCLLSEEKRLKTNACYKANNIRLLKEYNLYGEKSNPPPSTN